jgi:hypothetical protein
MTHAQPLWKRIAWMIGIWAASVLVLGLVSGVIRFFVKS